jgi:Glycosyl transferase 4-like domain
MLARELARRNFAVAIVTLDEPGGLREQIDGVDVIAQPASRTRAPVLRTVAFWLQMAGTLTANPARVVVQRSANIHAAPLALLTRLLRRRFVFASAGVRDFGRSEWKRQHRWLFDLGVRLADDVVVQTAEQVQLCQDSFGRQPTLIKSIGEPAEPRSSEPAAFLWIGRLSHYKRPLAYLELARSVPQAGFWMVAVPAASHEEGVDVNELARIAAAVPNLELCRPRLRHELVPVLRP